MIFKLLSILLRYPDDEVLEHRGEVAAAARDLPGSPAKDAVLQFLAYWENESPQRLQERYTETFDFKRRGCLYLSYYRYGDARARGQVLADMKDAYARAGYPLETTELQTLYGGLPGCLRARRHSAPRLRAPRRGRRGP